MDSVFVSVLASVFESFWALMNVTPGNDFNVVIVDEPSAWSTVV